MDWRIKDRAHTFHVDFLFDGEFVRPDPSSVAITLRKEDGEILDGWDAQTFPDDGTTGINFVVPVEFNLSTEEIGYRFVEVSYLFQGKPVTHSFSYALIEFIPLHVTPQTVRGLIGSQYKEVPDSDIDVVQAFFDLRKMYGPGFEVAVRAISYNAYAHRAVALKAALNLLPSLQTRLWKQERNDTSEWQRFSINLEDLRASLQADLEAALGEITDLESITTDYSLLMVTSPTDIITNT